MTHPEDKKYKAVKRFWWIVITLATSVGILSLPFILIKWDDTLTPLYTFIGCLVMIFVSIRQLNEADVARSYGAPVRWPWEN